MFSAAIAELTAAHWCHQQYFLATAWVVSERNIYPLIRKNNVSFSSFDAMRDIIPHGYILTRI